jgi:hypothetical protein
MHNFYLETLVSEYGCQRINHRRFAFYDKNSSACFRFARHPTPPSVISIHIVVLTE